MEEERDEQIVRLYFERDERAIDETKKRYSSYCRRIAAGLLRDKRDVEECENDVYLAAWKSIPPNRPKDLAGYLCKLTRRAAIDRVKSAKRRKRGGLCEALEEFEETLPSGESVEDAFESRELQRGISDFLRALPARERSMFLRRYWFGDSIAELCRTFACGKSDAKMKLLRTREKLKAYLRKEGFDV